MNRHPVSILAVLCLLLSLEVLAQEQTVDGKINRDTSIQAIREEPRRELSVLAPTLSEEEIDPAVLNRLMQEIARRPELVKSQLKIDDDKLQDIFITLSNARNFINTNEMASIRVMCQTWDNSKLTGEDRISEALQAYEHRTGFTKNFIARFYKIVLNDIEHGLNQPALISFKQYMDDRRRRMASAGKVTTGIPTQNVRSGAEAVTFHCGPAR